MKLQLSVLRSPLRQTMSELQVPAFVRNILDDIGDKNGFRDRTMKFETGSNPGDGFTSNIFRATISDRNSSKNLRLVYKVAPQSKNRRYAFDSSYTFANEAHFYNKVMPVFNEFQAEKRIPKDSQFSLIPKCFAAVADDNKGEFALVFEDLHSQGFRMWDRLKPSPIENTRLVMREIGKFHAISIAMKDQQPDRFAQLRKLPDIYENYLETPNLLPMFDESFERSITLLKSEEHKNIYRKIRSNVKGYFVECLKEKVDGKFGVLAHGDLWPNNVLYQTVNDTEIAKDIRILDWQTLGFVTPAIDVVFNIFASTDKALRDKEYQNLVRLYYQTVSNNVKLLGSNPEKLFTFDNLQDEMKRIGYFVLLVAPHYMQLCQATPADLEKWIVMHDAQDGKQPELYTILSESAKRVYGQKVNDVVGDIVRLGYHRKLTS